MNEREVMISKIPDMKEGSPEKPERPMSGQEKDRFIKSRLCNEKILQGILGGRKIAHGTSQPVIYRESDQYYLAVFVFFYTQEDIEAGTVSRPAMWAIADIETGEIIREYKTKEKDFSDAPYDVKYNIRSDAKYDTSKTYYDGAFEILDSVRQKIISGGKYYKAEYRYYIERILANIPKEYQRFYTDLSVSYV